MSVSLEKGQKVRLEKEGGDSLTKIAVGLGWDTNDGGGADFDLDASLYMLNKDGKCNNSRGLVYYGALDSPDGSVHHTGDNLTGEGDGDDEVIEIDLEKVPADVEKMVVVVNIYQASQRSQNFGQVENSFIRLLDVSNGANEEKFKFDLNFDAGAKDGVQFASIFRKDGKWALSADNIPFDGGLAALNQKYGV